MEKLTQYEEIIYYLHNGEILYMIDKDKATFFAYVKDKGVRVSNEHMHFFISEKQLQELFTDIIFYVYEKTQEEAAISDEKDNEYYRWQHK